MCMGLVVCRSGSNCFRVQGARQHGSRSAFALIALMFLASVGLTWPFSPVFSKPLDHASPSDRGITETYRWRPVAIGGGGFITGYSTDVRGLTRVIRTDVYGAYLWLANEGRWAQLVNSATMPVNVRTQDGVNEGVYEITVAPSDPQRIYMVIKGQVYRSDNQGKRFVKTGFVPTDPALFDPNSRFRHAGPFMAVDPANPARLLLGTSGQGLWRSLDAGRTWAKVESVPDSKSLDGTAGAMKPPALIWFEKGDGQSRSRVWAMSPGHGMYVAESAGGDFKRLLNKSAEQPVSLRQGAFAPDGAFFGVDAETKSAWRYSDGEWAALAGKGGLTARRFAAVAVHPQTGQVFVFDEGGRGFRSSNGGALWWPLLHRTRVGKADPPWLHVNNQSYFAIGRVQFDPVVRDRLWVDAGTGPYYADIGERTVRITWTSQVRGVEELVANDVISPSGGAPIFAAWDFGIHVKDDLDSFSTTYGPKERLLVSAQQLAWSPADPALVVTNASDARMCCADDGDAVLAGYSEDGGRRWRRFASLPQPPGTRADDPWRMAFGGVAISAGDTRNIVWVPTSHRSPYFTKDRGATWTRVTLQGERLPLTGSHSALHFHRKTLTADRVEPGVFYWMHSGEGQNAPLRGLWVTRDGGERWSKVFEGEIAPSSQYSAKLRAVPGRAGHLFFTSGVYNISDTRLRRSIDGGSSWRVLDRVDHVDDVAFGKAAPGASYPTIFISGRVGGRYGVWRSTDEARHWQRVGEFPVGTLDQVTVIEGDPDVFGRVYLGYKGSGWRYGTPARCKPGPYRFPDDTECSAVVANAHMGRQLP